MTGGKGNGGNFNNLAARRFKNVDKVSLMSQKEIFEILHADINAILDQVDNACGEHHGKFPVYLHNAFANISTALWFYRYTKDHMSCKIHKRGIEMKTDLTKREVAALRVIIAQAYKKSVTNFYATQSQEFDDRNKLLSKAFVMLCPYAYYLGKKLGLSKKKRRELAIQVYGTPRDNIRYVVKLFDEATSNISDKKKLKLMKMLYGKRFIDAAGAAMTLNKNDSDCVAMLFDHIRKQPKKKRKKYLRAYAEAYKKNATSNFRMTEAEFCEKNKKLFKALINDDFGYKKAYHRLSTGEQKPGKKKDMGDRPKASQGFTVNRQKPQKFTNK